MYENEREVLYKFANHLVFKESYEIIYINTEDEEIWLEKVEKRTSKVIRLLHKGFDWRNHLKVDIARVFQRTKALRKQLSGKSIEIYNVYSSSYMPIDEWKDLKRPLQLNEKRSIKMNVYYLTEDDLGEELARLQRDIGTTTELAKMDEQMGIEVEERIQEGQASLANALYAKKKKHKELFTFGKPFLTYILIAISIAVFLFMELNGGSTNIENLINYGAKYNPDIVDGEWWRIISAMFIHIGAFHLFMNMLALYYLGITVEKIYGSWRFFVIYLLAGIGGGLTSFAFSMNVSAGASGAIFGLFGALLFFGMIHKKIFLQTMGNGIITVIMINIGIGFIIPQIDISAHLGGLIAGFVVSAIVHLPKHRQALLQVTACITFCFILAGLGIYGVQTTTKSTVYQLMEIEELVLDEKYEEVIERSTRALKKPDDLEAELLFHRSYAYIHLEKPDLAIGDLEASVASNDQLHQSYFNLAKLYYFTGEHDQAIAAVQKAYRLQPDDQAYADLYEEITGEVAE